MSNASRAKLRDGDLLAAVDLGSNSFHMVVARHEQGELRLIDRLRETVRLAAGLHADGTLDTRHRDRALQCLARFGQRLAGFPPRCVRAVATNTVRQMRAPMTFLRAAERALGHAIEVVSGREEARLIWQGVVGDLPAVRARRLVIDVGGGSTEFIVGRGLDPELTESVQVGCIASTLRFFPDGRITRKRWQHALDEVGVLLQQFAADYRGLGWREAWGASGTFRAIAAIAHAMGDAGSGITPASLQAIRDAMIRAGSARAAALSGLSGERIPVIAGGVVVVEAAFAALGIERLRISENAMREGLLRDMLGRAAGRDPREASIRVLEQRYGTDAAQAQRVERVVNRLFQAVAGKWHLDESARDWLGWSARVHELGLAIAHSHHHRHAAYVLRHSDLAGFSNEEQQLLAAIVGNHRRRPDRRQFLELPSRLQQPARRVTALLRLAVLLSRAREEVVPFPQRVMARADTLKLDLTRNWRGGHPLTVTDLEAERALMRELGVKLVLGIR